MDNWKNIGIIKADGSSAVTIPSSPQQQSLPPFQPLPTQAAFMTNFSGGVAASAKSNTWLGESCYDCSYMAFSCVIYRMKEVTDAL